MASMSNIFQDGSLHISFVGSDAVIETLHLSHEQVLLIYQTMGQELLRFKQYLEMVLKEKKAREAEERGDPGGKSA
mgnify:FL=1|jgi:hypothetical protein